MAKFYVVVQSVIVTTYIYPKTCVHSSKGKQERKVEVEKGVVMASGPRIFFLVKLATMLLGLFILPFDSPFKLATDYA